jgi:hypothetical protein
MILTRIIGKVNCLSVGVLSSFVNLWEMILSCAFYVRLI